MEKRNNGRQVKDDLETLLQEEAETRGADLFGIASIDRFAEAPDEYHPHRFLPTCESVVVIGVRMTRGVTLLQKKQTAYLPYNLFCHGWLSNIAINLVLVNVARKLEEYEHLAIPLPFPCESSRLQKLIDERREQGNVSGTIINIGWPGEQFLTFKHAAVAAGLGEFGWNRLLLTPKLGPRQRLAIILTDAKLKASPLFKGRLCNPTDCGFRCVKICPAGALNGTEVVTFNIGNKRRHYAKFNELECAWVVSGLSRKTCKHATFDIDIPEDLTPERLITMKTMFHKESEGGATYEKYRLANTSSTYCGRCLIVCSEYLEERHKIENLFHEEEMPPESKTWNPS